MVRLIGLDPGLRCTGWGIIDVDGHHLRHVAHGQARSDGAEPLHVRLCQLFDAITDTLAAWLPDEAAVEETFVNKNAVSTLLLGQARGMALLAPAKRGIPVAEYPPNLIKKSVVGSGHAEKRQVKMMVSTLLPGVAVDSSDAADALACAICHAHHRQSATLQMALTDVAGAAGTAARKRAVGRGGRR